jgi:hypothetical protein
MEYLQKRSGNPLRSIFNRYFIKPRLFIRLRSPLVFQRQEYNHHSALQYAKPIQEAKPIADMNLFKKPQYVYAVQAWYPVHTSCCKGFNSRYSKVRTSIKGVYLDKETAKKIADGHNSQKIVQEGRCIKWFVTGYKVRDAK